MCGPLSRIFIGYVLDGAREVLVPHPVSSVEDTNVRQQSRLCVRYVGFWACENIR
jgi:hypothetical protein